MPIPKAYASEPEASERMHLEPGPLTLTLVPTDVFANSRHKLSKSESAAVAIGLRDPRIRSLDPSVLSRWLAVVFGFRSPNRLANPHLEALRVLANGLRAQREADIVRSIRAAQESGVGNDVIELVTNMVRAVRSGTDRH